MRLHIQRHTHKSNQTGCFSPSSLPFLQLLPTNSSEFRRNISYNELSYTSLTCPYASSSGLPPSQHVTRGSCLLVHSFRQTGIPHKGFSCSPLHSRYQMNTYLLNDDVLCQECPPTCPCKIPYRLKSHLNCLQRCPWSPPCKQNTYHITAIFFILSYTLEKVPCIH